MTIPFDLTADRLESIRTQAARGYAPTMRDTHALLAAVERLRAEVVEEKRIGCHLAAELGKSDGQLDRLRAESVPRSALVQVGWDCKHGLYVGAGPCSVHPDGRAVYVVREDTDA